jgi:hypothetical protein
MAPLMALVKLSTYVSMPASFGIFRDVRKVVIQACLKLGPIGPLEVWTLQEVEKGWSTPGIDQYG